MQEEDLVYRAGYQIQDMILKKEISCKEVTQIFLKRIKRLNPYLHAYLLVLEELALKQANRVDQGAFLNDMEATLVGIPISIKDLLLDIQEHVTTNGSLVCKAFIASNDSLAVKRLRHAGAIFLGKTNVPEFGTEFITQNKLGDPTANPWDLSRTAGGSSGGAAASVAAGLASIALANDSAGSIRLPSSLCSLFGYMPSYGRVPIITQEEKLFKPMHRIGPIARCVKDAALMLNVLSQSTALDEDHLKPIDFVQLLEKDPKKLKLGWSPDLGFGIRNPETLKVIETRLKELEDLGFEIEEIKLPLNLNHHLEDLAHFIISRFDFLSEEIPLIAKPLLGSQITTMINKALKVKESEVEKALSFQKEFVQKMDAFMQNYDLLLTPTCAYPAFPIENFRQEVKKVHPDPFLLFAHLLYPFNVTGQPAASLPCGFTFENLPIGLQVIGGRKQDATLFQFCGFYERAFPWMDKKATI